MFDEPLAASPDAAFDVLPVSQASTMARRTDGRILLVVGATPQGVDAVDVNAALQITEANPLALLRESGYERLAALLGEVSQPEPLESLGMPFDPAYPHIAAGTNFRAHAEEVGLDDGPFLFLKLTRATAWNAPVP